MNLLLIFGRSKNVTKNLKTTRKMFKTEKEKKPFKRLQNSYQKKKLFHIFLHQFARVERILKNTMFSKLCINRIDSSSLIQFQYKLVLNYRHGKLEMQIHFESSTLNGMRINDENSFIKFSK